MALRDGRIVGYVTVAIKTRPSYWQVQRVGHISGLMVDAEHRREGIGTELLQAAVTYLKERGLTYYTVYTAVGNEEAVTFYEARGMEPLYSHLVGIADSIPD